MARVTKPVKKKIGTKPPPARKSARAGSATRSLAQRLKDALDQQAATSEILRVMADSPTDVQPVLDAVAQRAADLCRSPFARIFLAEGDVLRPAAHFSVGGENSIPVYPVPLRRT